MIVLIDNYDSFTYNIFQYLAELGAKVKIYRNDVVNIPQLKEMSNKIDSFILSPGPGCPDDAGICLDLVNEFYRTKPILGICLGHQVIAQSFGAQIIPAGKLMHGKVDLIEHSCRGIFKDVPFPLSVTRYHSLVVKSSNLPACLTVTARSGDSTIMAIRHRRYPVHGVQFHPESYMTQCGIKIIQNFLMNQNKRKNS